MIHRQDKLSMGQNDEGMNTKLCISCGGVTGNDGESDFVQSRVRPLQSLVHEVAPPLSEANLSQQLLEERVRVG